MSTPDLLRVEGLTTAFTVGGRSVPVVRGVSFQVRAGETVALVGESGSGKSVTALSLLRLLPTSGRITGGSVQWRARDLAGLKNPALEQIRGGETALVPQDPATALNPVFTVGDQIMETLLAHAVATPRDVHRRMLDLLDTVHIPHPAQRASVPGAEPGTALPTIDGVPRARLCVRATMPPTVRPV